MNNPPVPTVQQREHMRQVRNLHRRPDGVVVMRVPNGAHRNASKTVMDRLLNQHRWIAEPAPGVFALTDAGIAALARSSQ